MKFILTRASQKGALSFTRNFIATVLIVEILQMAAMALIKLFAEKSF